MEQETMKARRTPQPPIRSKPVETNKKPSKSDSRAQAPGPYAGLGAAKAAELMIGFWFGIGVVLAVKMLESLEYCIRRKANKMAEENQVRKEPQQKRKI